MLKAQNFCGCVYCVYLSACVSGHQWCWHIIVRLVQTTNIFTPAPHNAAGPRHQCPALTHRARKRNIHITSCLLAAQWPQSYGTETKNVKNIFVKYKIIFSQKINTDICFVVFCWFQNISLGLLQAAQHRQIQLHHSTTAAFLFTALD